MPKFMQSLGTEAYQRLVTEAKTRDVTVQSLIRTVIVPDWLKTVPVVQTTIQTTAPRPIIQTAPLLSRTGVATVQTRRPFLTTTIGRGKP